MAPPAPASIPPPPQRENLPETEPPLSEVPLPPRATPTSTLLASVDSAIAAGDLERAAALCERALRINPRDGNLWYRLATIRLQQSRYEDAVGFARRALSFSAANPALTAASNRVLDLATAALNRNP